jgi:hypothetical protein
MKHGRLTPLQCAVLDAFSGQSGSSFSPVAMRWVGFHLYHRETTDLDLFTSSAEASTEHASCCRT